MPVTIRPCSSTAEKQRSLGIFNDVWPRRAATDADVQAWERASIASADFLGAIDGEEAGSAATGVPTSLPDICVTFVTVLPHMRRRGVGAALFENASAWAREQDVRELETVVESDDAESLGFALRRGFREHSREVGLELDLAELEPPAVDPPRGIEIALLADRPELATGAYEVGIEAIPDVPGSEDWTPPPFEQFAATHLRGLAIFVAVAAEEVVGYAKLHETTGGRAATHGMTALKRAWRGQGIAKALKRAEINGQRRTASSASRRRTRNAMRRCSASMRRSVTAKSPDAYGYALRQNRTEPLQTQVCGSRRCD